MEPDGLPNIDDRQPKIDFKKVIEVIKVLGYSLVFSVLLLVVIMAILNKNINLSKIFNSTDSKAEIIKQLKAIPLNK